MTEEQSVVQCLYPAAESHFQFPGFIVAFRGPKHNAGGLTILPHGYAFD